ncbi:MAG: hypothetical protein U5N56_02120 [Candidatus Marinimicrobia bacterium]|nr:hypothetical protein [Candidatus Neomarinimicrobiota bacterium]
MHFNDIYKRVNIQEPKTINVVFPDKEPVYEALSEATEKKYIFTRLYGIPENVRKLAKRTG